MSLLSVFTKENLLFIGRNARMLHFECNIMSVLMLLQMVKDSVRRRCLCHFKGQNAYGLIDSIRDVHHKQK